MQVEVEAFLLEAEAVMIMGISVDQTGHFSWWYDMDRNAELVLLITDDMNECQVEFDFVPMVSC